MARLDRAIQPPRVRAALSLRIAWMARFCGAMTMLEMIQFGPNLIYPGEAIRLLPNAQLMECWFGFKTP